MAAIAAGLLVNLFILGNRVLDYDEHALNNCMDALEHMQDIYDRDISDFTQSNRDYLALRDEALMDLQSALDAGWLPENRTRLCGCRAQTSPNIR